jgi:NAD-dependent DNA ligase
MNSPKLNIDDHEHLLTLYNLPLMKKRAIQELHGIATAIIYDGRVSDDEINLIIAWIERNQVVHDEWPVSRLIEMLRDILSDNIVTQDERFELLTFLIGIASSTTTEEKVIEGIFTENPKIIITNNCFLFTGKLQFGKRSKAENAVIQNGGVCCERYTHAVDYLVVGELGQEAWKYSRYGNKIEACMKAKSNGLAKTDIVREDDFIKTIIVQGG